MGAHTSTFSAPDIRGGCSLHTTYSESYSYGYGGVTYVSPVTSIACKPLPAAVTRPRATIIQER